MSALSLAACACTPPDGPGGPGGPGGRPGSGPPPGEDGRGPGGPGGPGGGPGGKQVFISPAGEPFRADAGQPYPVAAWFAGADANHDGVLTRDEFVADALRFFDRLDTDKSGELDGFEVSTYERVIAPEIVQASAMPQQAMDGPSGGGGPDGDGPRRRPNGLGNMLLGATPFALLAEPQPVMGADADFNRRITREEATKAAISRFKLLDKDGDGKLTLAELPKTAMQKILDGDEDDRGGKKGRGRGRGGPPPRG
ncbi:MAG: hypothetical protein QM608_01800 [Caulobacter sp.]